jgi:rhodanese-related sulfurtransferase
MSLTPAALAVNEIIGTQGSAAIPIAKPVLVDVRREADFAQAGRWIAGSLRRDISEIESWGPTFIGQWVVVYCAHGRAVSQGACQRLLDLGVAASYLEGGYAAWTAAGAPTEAALRSSEITEL